MWVQSHAIASNFTLRAISLDLTQSHPISPNLILSTLFFMFCQYKANNFGFSWSQVRATDLGGVEKKIILFFLKNRTQTVQRLG